MCMLIYNRKIVTFETYTCVLHWEGREDKKKHKKMWKMKK